MRFRLVFAAALAMSVLTFGASALADVIGAAPACAPWESAEVHHGSARCTPRACTRDRECSGARCETRRVCVVREEVWVSRPGPCRDLDGDGECDRQRQTREREAGVCPVEGSCAEGHCRTRGTCHP